MAIAKIQTDVDNGPLTKILTMDYGQDLDNMLWITRTKDC